MVWEISKYIIVILSGYAIGNVSFARIISKKMNIDITKKGSGNPGSMNMLRTFGFKIGLLNLVLDSVKGSLAALIGFFTFGGSVGADLALNLNLAIGIYVGGLSAVMGHNFPIIYKFKGGKGVACILGVFAVANPIWSLVAFGVAVIFLCVFDYGAVASFAFITILTILEGVKYSGKNLVLTILLFILFFLTFFMHRHNIARLLWGKENRVNLAKAFKKKKPKVQGINDK